MRGNKFKSYLLVLLIFIPLLLGLSSSPANASQTKDNSEIETGVLGTSDNFKDIVKSSTTGSQVEVEIPDDIGGNPNQTVLDVCYAIMDLVPVMDVSNSSTEASLLDAFSSLITNKSISVSFCDDVAFELEKASTELDGYILGSLLVQDDSESRVVSIFININMLPKEEVVVPPMEEVIPPVVPETKPPIEGEDDKTETPKDDDSDVDIPKDDTNATVPPDDKVEEVIPPVIVVPPIDSEVIPPSDIPSTELTENSSSKSDAQSEASVTLDTKELFNSTEFNSKPTSRPWKATKEKKIVDEGLLTSVYDNDKPVGLVVDASAPLDTSTDVSLNVISSDSFIDTAYLYSEELNKFIKSETVVSNTGNSVSFLGTNKKSYILAKASEINEKMLVSDGWNNTVKDGAVKDWYYVENEDCVNGWKRADNDWYYLADNKVMQTGWLQEGSSWYYLNPISNGRKGAMLTGWKNINSKWYHFNENGKLSTNTVVDGYTVDSNGVLI